jgi:hypothetical protein
VKYLYIDMATIFHLFYMNDALRHWGIMRPAWDESDLASISRGVVRFTPMQAAAMRSKIAAGCQPSASW